MGNKRIVGDTEVYTFKEMTELRNKEKDKQCVSRWFKHSTENDTYAYSIGMFELKDFTEEVI